jgi:hypothetical protein
VETEAGPAGRFQTPPGFQNRTFRGKLSLQGGITVRHSLAQCLKAPFLSRHHNTRRTHVQSFCLIQSLHKLLNLEYRSGKHIFTLSDAFRQVLLSRKNGSGLSIGKGNLNACRGSDLG